MGSHVFTPWRVLVLLALANNTVVHSLCAQENIASSKLRNSRTEANERTATPAIQKLEKPGIENLFRLNSWLISGSNPHGREGFESLKSLGIKTIVSVDGAEPEVKLARELGLRYVHIPIGYDGISPEKLAQLTKVAQSLPRPLFVHCHHGKHRGPTAAAVMQLGARENCTATQTLEDMRVMGTDPKYAGLYQAVRTFELPSSAQLQAISEELPEVAKVPDLTEAMVRLDETWDRLKKLEASGWDRAATGVTSKASQEVLQFVEHYRELQRMPEIKQRQEEFLMVLDAALKHSEELEKQISNKNFEPANVKMAFQESAKACSACHTRFRDVIRETRPKP